MKTNKGGWHAVTDKLFGKINRPFNKASHGEVDRVDYNTARKARTTAKFNKKQAKFDAKASKKQEKAAFKVQKDQYKAKVKHTKEYVKKAKAKNSTKMANLQELGKNNPIFDKMANDHFGMSWNDFAAKHGAKTMSMANKFKGMFKKLKGTDLDSALNAYAKNPTANNLTKIEDVMFNITNSADRDAMYEYKQNMAKYIPIGLAVAIAMTAMQGSI